MDSFQPYFSWVCVRPRQQSSRNNGHTQRTPIGHAADRGVRLPIMFMAARLTGAILAHRCEIM
jgi:hypothetical protein